MYEFLEPGTPVYVGFGKRGIQGWHYTKATVTNVSPVKHYIQVGDAHFKPDGSSFDGSTYHIELATPEFEEALRQKEYIRQTEFRLLGFKPTYEQAVKINHLIDTLQGENYEN